MSIQAAFTILMILVLAVWGLMEIWAWVCEDTTEELDEHDPYYPDIRITDRISNGLTRFEE